MRVMEKGVHVLCIAGSSMQGVCAVHMGLVWQCASVSGVCVYLLRTLPVATWSGKDVLFYI